MKLKKRTKRVLWVLLFAIVIVAVIVLLLKFNNRASKVGVAKVVNEISDYGYQLKDNKSKLYKQKFSELEDILSQEEVDEEKYAQVVAEMFVIDFYTLNDKLANTDVGGVDFVHQQEREDFLEKAMNTVYRHVENNLYGTRNQKLPVVKETTVESVEQISFDYLDTTDAASYRVHLRWDYEADLGYETEATIILVHEDQKLSIVEMD